MADNSKKKEKAPKKQIDFIVTTSNPNDALSSKANKKRVRSVAALKSWPERRKKMFQQLEDANTGHGAFHINEIEQEPQPQSQPRPQQQPLPPSQPQQQVASYRAWPERRTKPFQRDQSSTTGHGEFYGEQPEQEVPARQQLYAQAPLHENFNTARAGLHTGRPDRHVQLTRQASQGYMQSTLQRIASANAGHRAQLVERPEPEVQARQQAPPVHMQRPVPPMQSFSAAYEGTFMEVPPQQIQTSQGADPVPIQITMPHIETSNTDHGGYLIEEIVQQVQGGQQPSPVYPAVPPGWMEWTERFPPHFVLPDRSTPPRDRQFSGSNSSSSSITNTAGSSLVLHHPPPAQPRSGSSAGANVPCECIHCQPAPPVTAHPKKRTADGRDKNLQHFNVLTPPASPPNDLGSARWDPFNCYAVEWQPWFDQILHHMCKVYAPRGWGALKITNEQGIRWEYFLSQNALSEPALLYVRLLFGSGDMIRLGAMRLEFMYWLRARAIAAINEALGDPNRACSDALILAVGRIAIHEHMYGDRNACVAVHRPAQKRMVEMRGGMSQLGFPELVKRLMRWSDQIMAVGTGTARMLEDDGPGFTLKESVGAIQKWAPQEMPRVRKHIKLSELINDEEA